MPSDAARLTRSQDVGERLAALSDAQLRDLVAEAHPLAVGIGGATFRAVVLETPVFIKRVPLTEVERQAGNVGSTADLHGLPVQYHYGVGSAGASAWREVEAHRLTDHWVRTGQCEMFPLLHHWRVLSGGGDVQVASVDQDDLDAVVAYWHGSPAVRQRLNALADASAGLYLFIEHVPQTLAEWLSAKLAAGPDVLDGVCNKLADDLVSTATFLSRQDLCHFDAHFRNIMTDGERLYFSDFGLALSSTFNLLEDEDRFLGEHRNHDVGYVIRELVNWLVEAFADDAPSWTDASERNDLIRRYAEGRAPLQLPPGAAAIVSRFAAVAAVLNDFYFHLYRTSRYSAFPAQELRSACASAGLPRD